MKKIILTMAAVFAVSFANAQDSKGGSSDMKFGVKAGLNNSNYTGDADTDAATSFYIGGLVDFTVSEKFHVQPELLYSRQGSEADTLKIKVDYISIPLMVKYYLSEKFSVEAGPQMSFLVNNKVEYDKAEWNNSIFADRETNASSFDFGLNIGFGYNITSNLFAQVRYNYGITTVAENPDIKNSVFQFSLGYKL